MGDQCPIEFICDTYKIKMQIVLNSYFLRKIKLGEKSSAFYGSKHRYHVHDSQSSAPVLTNVNPSHTNTIYLRYVSLLKNLRGCDIV